MIKEGSKKFINYKEVEGEKSPQGNIHIRLSNEDIEKIKNNEVVTFNILNEYQGFITYDKGC